jgi:hypothetical protein
MSAICGPNGRIKPQDDPASGIEKSLSMYIGLIVFNKMAYRKNPTTERRVSRLNASDLHVVHEVPSLRIVDDDLWGRVKRRQAKHDSR